jgi:hypothetical protein
MPGTVTLNGAAPPGGVTVTLSTSNLVASPPPIVLVPAGASSAGFSVATSAVTANTLVTITGIFGAASKSASLTVQPPAAPPPTLAAPTLQSPAADAQPSQPVTFSWSSVTGAASYEVQIDDNNAFTAPLTQSLTPTAPSVSTSGLPNTRLFWRVRARNSAGTAGAWSAARRFQPLAAPAAAALAAVSASPTSMTGGGPAQGTVTLSAPAPAGGALVTLGSSNAAATLPASVTIAAGSSSATFPITTTAVTASTPVTITASFNGAARTTILTVAPPAAATLTAVSATPSSLTGGAPAQGTVTLSTVAPAGGALVTLGSSNAAATLPASVTVAAGSASATFPITTTAVTASTPVTITASFGGAARTTILTVAPPAAPDLTPPTVSLTGPLAGATVSGIATITATAADNVGVTRVDFLVDGVLLASDAAAPWSASWNTATSANGSHSLTARAFDAANNSTTSAAVAVTVNNGAPPVTTLALTALPATVVRGQTFPATAAVSNGGGSSATGMSVAISFTPTTSMRLSSPQVASQSVPAVAAAGLQNVTWQLRADNAGVATVTMTLRDAGGALVATQSRQITINN